MDEWLGSFRETKKLFFFKRTKKTKTKDLKSFKRTYKKRSFFYLTNNFSKKFEKTIVFHRTNDILEQTLKKKIGFLLNKRFLRTNLLLILLFFVLLNERFF